MRRKTEHHTLVALHHLQKEATVKEISKYSGSCQNTTYKNIKKLLNQQLISHSLAYGKYFINYNEITMKILNTHPLITKPVRKPTNTIPKPPYTQEQMRKATGWQRLKMKRLHEEYLQTERTKERQQYKADYQMQRRKQYALLRKCYSCKQQLDGKSNMCSSCLEKKKFAKRQNADLRNKLGICALCSQHLKSKTLCATHLSKSLSAQKKYRVKKKVN